VIAYTPDREVSQDGDISLWVGKDNQRTDGDAAYINASNAVLNNGDAVDIDTGAARMARRRREHRRTGRRFFL
jgi:hypothetical protein